MLQSPYCRHFSDKEAKETTSKCHAWVSHWYPWAICHIMLTFMNKGLEIRYLTLNNLLSIGTWLWRKWRRWLLWHMGRLLWYWRWQRRKVNIGYLPETEDQFWKVCPETKQWQPSQRSDIHTAWQHLLWPGDHPLRQVYPGKFCSSK